MKKWCFRQKSEQTDRKTDKQTDQQIKRHTGTWT